MPAYSYAILSALLWAASAPVLNIGLKNIPDDSRSGHLIVGLYVAMLAGIVALFPFSSVMEGGLEMSTEIVFAGLFTYPLATGIYYVTGLAFNKRIEFASQFAKVKPIFSVLFSLLILREVFSYLSYVSFGLITAGILLMLFSGTSEDIPAKAVLLGLLTAVLWALGELFMTRGIGSMSAIDANFVALSASAILFSVVALPFIVRRGLKSHPVWQLWPFLVHGVMSFGIAYSLFFESIKVIGLGRSVLVNAFWPVAAIILTGGIRIANRQDVAVPFIIWLAILFILCGSLLQGIALL